MKKMKNAFTLAEVLIALTIIGVAAALTVPALIQRTQKQEYVSALQKAYSTLSQATNMIIAGNGSPLASDDGEAGWAVSAENSYNLYKKNLSNVKDCGEGTGCFRQITNTKYKWLHGGTSNILDSYTGKYKLILADGTQVMFEYATSIIVDINGEKKPNTVGRDVFQFIITNNGLKPFSCGDFNYNNNSGDIGCVCTSKKGNGWACAAKVLAEGKMDY